MFFSFVFSIIILQCFYITGRGKRWREDHSQNRASIGEAGPRENRESSGQDGEASRAMMTTPEEHQQRRQEQLRQETGS
jgi:hypothetical protein